MNKNRKFILYCVTVLFISATVSVSNLKAGPSSSHLTYPPFPDEEKVLSQIKKEESPSPLLLWQLSRLRLQHAAELYKSWKQNKNAEAFQEALIYAGSSTELSPDWDEAWLLSGLLYSEMKATPQAMEKAADALVHAVDINPANGRAQLLLAQVLMEQGRYWSAIEQFKMLIQRNEAMRTPAVLSQLTFCYIADQRFQAGIDYVSKAPDISGNDATAKLRWQSWKLINQAILMRAKGDEQAAGFLKVMFFYHDPSLTVIDEYQRYAKYLLKLWEKEGQNEKAN